MRDRLSALLAVLFLATGLAVLAGPRAAYADQQPAPSGWSGAPVAFCTANQTNTTPKALLVRCNYYTMSEPFYYSTVYDGNNSFQGYATSTNACPAGVTHEYVDDTAHKQIRFTVCGFNITTPNLGLTMTTPDVIGTWCCSSQNFFTGYDPAYSTGYIGGALGAIPVNNIIGAAVYPVWPTYWFAGGSGPPPDCSSFVLGRPDPDHVGQQIAVVVPHFLDAGVPITFTLALAPRAQFTKVDVYLYRTKDASGADLSPKEAYKQTLNGPFPVWGDGSLGDTVGVAQVSITTVAAGTYESGFTCWLANGTSITGGTFNAGTGGTTSYDLCADPTLSPGISACQTGRPNPSDCLPSTSGGLFGILGSVLDPTTYVRATVCMAQALFEPGPATTNAIQSLWATAIVRAPFSYVHDVLTFLPATFSAFSSGLASTSTSCLVNVPGAGCATIASSGDLGLVRTVLLFLFVGLICLAVVKTTMRIVNGG